MASASASASSSAAPKLLVPTTYSTCLPTATLYNLMVIANKHLGPGSAAKGIVDFMKQGVYFNTHYPSTPLYEKHLPPDTLCRLALFLGDDITKWPAPVHALVGLKTGIHFHLQKQVFSVLIVLAIPETLNAIFRKVNASTSVPLFFPFTLKTDQVPLLTALVKYEKFLQLLAPLEAKVAAFKILAEKKWLALPTVVGQKKPPIETYLPTAEDRTAFEKLRSALE